MNRNEYPVRPKMATWARYLCMTFGIAIIVGSADSVRTSTIDLFLLLGSLLVGGVWFSFGLYGGLPLVGTVYDWHSATEQGEVTDMHRQGLLVIRRRRWLMWTSLPLALVATVFLAPLFIKTPGIIVFILGVPLTIINFRYFLSRCPRCGYGFFTNSTSRAAAIKSKKSCGHCGLSLYAYKEAKP